MNVEAPSNIERISELYVNAHDRLKADIESVSYNDEQIGETIRRVYGEADYLLDPHGAVAYRALEERLRPGEIGISLEPVHPAKFVENEKNILNIDKPLPSQLADVMRRHKRSIPMSPLFADLKKFLLQEM